MGGQNWPWGPVPPPSHPPELSVLFAGNALTHALVFADIILASASPPGVDASQWIHPDTGEVTSEPRKAETEGALMDFHGRTKNYKRKGNLENLSFSKEFTREICTDFFSARVFLSFFPLGEIRLSLDCGQQALQ